MALTVSFRSASSEPATVDMSMTSIGDTSCTKPKNRRAIARCGLLK